MDRWLAPVLLLLGLAPGPALQCDPQLIQNLTGRLLLAVPPNANRSCVSTLLLDGNRIALDPTDRRALEEYPALLELRLEENLLTRVPDGFFSVVPNLRTLSVAKNDIRSLDSGAFSGLDLLTHLDLSENRLTRLPARLAGQLASLQVLDLRGNLWNCSCPLLGPVAELHAANVSLGGTVSCASPPDRVGTEVLEAAARCPPSPPDNGTDPAEPTAPGESEQPTSPSATQNSTQNHNSTAGRTPAPGNSWKFTACVAALALVTSALIVCAVKGPSWYKLFHNYRHRRLRQDGDDDGGGGPGTFVATVFKKKGSYRTPPALGFQNQNQDWPLDEAEDEYFEDPYIRDAGGEGDETPAEP